MKYVEWKELHAPKLSVLKAFSAIKYKSENLPLYRLLNDKGNRKLPSTTAIFNMATATNCPSKKLNLCKASLQGAHCYALKAEYLYPQVLPYRKKQAIFWKKVNAEDFAHQFLMINAFKKNPFNALRVNESGDFNSQECVDKMEKIARILKRYGIVTYAYTSRSDLDFSRVRDFVIHGSGFSKVGIRGIFKIIPNKKAKVKGYSMCRMSCKVCQLCQKFSNVCVVKH
ncbi:MAG: hypothetical protein ABFD15_02210 [Methanofastidiosum sp.]